MKPDFKKSISLATSVLLGVSPVASAVESIADTTVNSSILYYTEDGRVTTVAPQINIVSNLNEDNVLSLTLLYDSVTGSSPTGEVPSGFAQTVTSTSGNVKTIAGDKKPLKSFNDERESISLSLTHNINRLLKVSGGLTNSNERDYKSTGFNIGLSKDTEDRLSTYNIAISQSQDDITGTASLDGIGGLPEPLTNSLNKLRQAQSDTKDDFGFQLGLTQVLTKTSIIQLSYTKNKTTGYHNDPYKLVSLVDAAGNSLAGLYESRPSTRDRDILYGRYTKYFKGDIFNFDYRYFQDDWGINSHTIGLKYRVKMGNNFALEPHFRFYRQSAADFHQFYLESSANVPDYISADSRLSAFNTKTVGVKVSYNPGGYKLSARLEKMQQQSDNDTSQAPGKLAQYDLFAPISAYIVQVDFSMSF